MSAKAVAEKIHLKKGKQVLFFNQPENLRELLGAIPEGVIVSDEGKADIILAFIENSVQLKRHMSELKEYLNPEGALWIAYHKGTSSVDTDINRDSIIKFASKHHLKGVAMVSINENWSALRLKMIY